MPDVALYLTCTLLRAQVGLIEDVVVNSEYRGRKMGHRCVWTTFLQHAAHEQHVAGCITVRICSLHGTRASAHLQHSGTCW
jgi:hypothetical protein